MKFYCKTILIITALFAVITMKAQNMPLTFGVKAGLNLSDVDSDLSTDSKIGFLIGATVDYSFSDNWMLMSGLELTTKGADLDGRGNGKVNAIYLQTPVHLGYKFRITRDIQIVPHAGTYLAYGIGGKTKIAGHKIDTFDKMMHHLDFGIGTGAGVEYREFFFDLSYEYGIIDTGRKNFDIQNETIYLTAAYKF